MDQPTGTTPPNKIWTEHGGVYQHPRTDEQFDSVTTALECFDKDGLVPWSGWLAAKATFAELPKIVKAWRVKECGRTWSQCSREHGWQQRCAACPCRECKTCTLRWLADRHIAEKTRRSDEGTRIHAIADGWRKQGVWSPHDNDIAGYVQALAQWTTDYRIQPDDWEATETTILNRQHGYAGTLDGMVWLFPDRCEPAAEMCARIGRMDQPALVQVDLKSREKDDRFFLDYALQGSAYERGECVMLPDGTEVELPPVHAVMILQVHPVAFTDGGKLYRFDPVDTTELTFEQFLRTLASHRWRRDHGTAAISKRGFPLPDEYKKRRAAARRAAKKTTPPAEPPQLAIDTTDTGLMQVLPDMVAAGQSWDALATSHGKGRPQLQEPRHPEPAIPDQPVLFGTPVAGPPGYEYVPPDGDGIPF